MSLSSSLGVWPLRRSRQIEARAVAGSAAPAAKERRPLLYCLLSSNMYGTERMTIATLAGLVDDFDPVLFTPPGPAQTYARSLGLGAQGYVSSLHLARMLMPYLWRNRSLVYVASSVRQSWTMILLNLIFWRRVVAAQIIHAGADVESRAYGKKKRLNFTGVNVIAVSEYVRERLIAHGVRASQIHVINNFLLPQRIASFSRRAPFTQPGIKKVILISRLANIKRIEVLLDALELEPRLREMSFEIVGTGPESERLRERASPYPNVRFAGYCDHLTRKLCESDLLLHTCPEEPFGLVILEAMAADVPVLVPDCGGTRYIVEDGISGFTYRGGDAARLAARLLELNDADPGVMNRVVAGGREVIHDRFSADASLREYRKLFGSR